MGQVTMPKIWQGKWITPEESCQPELRQPAGYLRKRFFLPNRSEAVLFATAHGLYRVYLNGQPVGEDLFTPGCDEYDKRLQVQRYPVSELLQKGENEILAVLGDGWYRGCNGIDSVRNLFGEDLSFLCQIETEGQPVVWTDPSWEGSQDGPIRMTDLEQGEIYDARREEITDWHAVRTLEFGYDALVNTQGVSVREHEVFSGKPFTAPNGEIIYDFGQNLAGYTQLEVIAQGGEILKLTHGEALDRNGNFTIENFQPGERNKMGGIRQEIVYTCKPGRNVFQPTFSLFGFRYARLESELPPEAVSLKAIAVYSDMQTTASFICSEPAVNRLFQNSLWSMKGNFCDIPTDCPTRERAGWTGDAGIFAPVGLRLMDSLPVFRKWLANARCCQREDGKMAYIVPRNGPAGQIAELFSASVGWGDAAVLVPWALYEYSGDQEILKENYEMMKKWVDFLERRAKEQRPGSDWGQYADLVIDTGMDYGEWNEPGSNVMADMQKAYQQGQPEVATAYFCHSAELLSQTAGILGKTADSRHYGELARQVKEAYQWLWRKTVSGSSRRQCEYVRPLAFDLLEAEERKSAAAQLEQLVIENGYQLNTGFLSTPYLCRVLAENGAVDTAYRLLLQEKCPGWLYAVKKGATTIWETWDGVREDGSVHDSLNHYSYGSISGWLLEGVCGIRYRFDSLILRPVLSPLLRWAEASLDSPRGRILSRWEYDSAGTHCAFHFELPKGVGATIILPDRDPLYVEGGNHDFEIETGR